jgi:hypothetical protein
MECCRRQPEAAVNITDRGQNSVALSLDATELMVLVNALEFALRTTDPDDEAACRRVQRPLLEALRHLRPKAHLSDGRWSTDWARGEDGKHL